MDNPILFYKHSKWEIITIEILYFVSILVGLKFIIQGIVEKDWFLLCFGICIVIWSILFFSKALLDVKGYLAVYSNKLVEKKKHYNEVLFNDVIEVKYFKKAKKERSTTFYMDYLQFYLKDKETPVLISSSFKGTVTPYKMKEETIEILAYIQGNFPIIKYTKENWNVPY